jgi:predicted membrane protein
LGLLRGIGYFIAILILIGGIITLPIGIVGIVFAIIIMYVLHKGAQMKTMKNDLRALRTIEEEKLRAQVEAERRDALHRKWAVGTWEETEKQ